jgi:hydrogenase expression/formation protein HypE
MNRYGKPGPDFMEKVVYRNLGTRRRDILVGPKRGFDNAVVSMEGGGVMVATTDPVSAVPEVGMSKSAWLSVHLVASDLACSGIGPQFATFSFSFPKAMSDDDVKAYLEGIGSACREIGVAVVSGHTGRYPGAEFPIVGAGTILGFAEDGAYIDPSMAGVGDVVIMTKGAAVEATAFLASSFPKFTEKTVGKDSAAAAWRMLDDCTVVKDAKVAASVGLGKDGVTSMHDATEGGVLGALQEMSGASGRGFKVNAEAIFVSKAARRICSTFGLDPLTTLSEGTLLLTCVPKKAKEVQDRLRAASVEAFEIGSVTDGEGVWMSPIGGSPRKVKPKPDRYWDTYEKSVARGLN